MTKVIKRSGKKQAFSSSKLRRSIEKAGREAKISGAKLKNLVEEIAKPVIALAKKKRLIKATDIRKSILARLDKKAKSASKAWRRFDKKRRK